MHRAAKKAAAFTGKFLFGNNKTMKVYSNKMNNTPYSAVDHKQYTSKDKLDYFINPYNCTTALPVVNYAYKLTDAACISIPSFY